MACRPPLAQDVGGNFTGRPVGDGRVPSAERRPVRAEALSLVVEVRGRRRLTADRDCDRRHRVTHSHDGHAAARSGLSEAPNGKTLIVAAAWVAAVVAVAVVGGFATDIVGS